MKLKRGRSGGSAIVTNSRWMAYATAGAASALGCVASAQARIHYSGLINQKFTGYDYASFQLDQPSDYFYLSHNPHFYSTFSVSGGSAHLGVFGQAGASFAGFYNTCAYNPEVESVSDLSRGQVLSTRPFVPGTRGILATADGFDCGGGDRGQFRGINIGFIGFEFNNGSGVQYGWARLQMGNNSSFKLIDYAYGDVGDRIKVGQRGNGSAPERESLGALALGAAGVVAWRKRRARLDSAPIT